MTRDEGRADVDILKRFSPRMEVKATRRMLSNIDEGVLHNVQTGFSHVDFDDVIYMFRMEFVVTDDREKLMYIMWRSMCGLSCWYLWYVACVGHGHF